MSYSVLADVGGPILFAGFGVVAYLALSLLESIVLRLLKWGTAWRSLLGSLAMNLPSTLLGFWLIWLAGFSRLDRWGIWLIPPTWALSVAIEGAVLVLMKRDGGRQNWIAALAANTASYLLLLAQRVAVS
jgi:hypothetical protein